VELDLDEYPLCSGDPDGYSPLFDEPFIEEVKE